MLPRSERLRRPSEFQATYQSGRTYADALLVLHVEKLPDRPDIRQVGFTVSKKVGNAVVRNRLKRRLRAIFAKVLPELALGHRMIVRARPRAAEVDFAVLEAVVMGLLERAHLRASSPVDKGSPGL